MVFSVKRLVAVLPELIQHFRCRNKYVTVHEEEVMTNSRVFWKDLEQDLQDPEFVREYVAETIRIATIDSVMNALESARTTLGLSKAELARAVQVEPAAMRRMFSVEQPNPTLATLSQIAAALGMRVTLEPFDTADERAIAEPLRSGQVRDVKRLVRQLEVFQNRSLSPLHS